MTGNMAERENSTLGNLWRAAIRFYYRDCWTRGSKLQHLVWKKNWELILLPGRIRWESTLFCKPFAPVYVLIYDWTGHCSSTVVAGVTDDTEKQYSLSKWLQRLLTPYNHNVRARCSSFRLYDSQLTLKLYCRYGVIKLWPGNHIQLFHLASWIKEIILNLSLD